MNYMLGDLWVFKGTLLNTGERQQTHALDRGATGFGTRMNNKHYSSADFTFQFEIYCFIPRIALQQSAQCAPR
jgi:hypothetical protein